MAQKTKVIWAFDTETYPIKPGRQAPKIVCVQSSSGGLESREKGLDTLEHILRNTDHIIVGHNVSYDVLCSIASRPRLRHLWLEAYKSDRVTCTLEREKLIRIAEGTLGRYGKHGLIDLVNRYKIPDPYDAGVKDSAVRVEYYKLDGKPLDRWPKEAIDYALADLVVLDVYNEQDKFRRWLEDEYRQARGALWLASISAHGMRVDPKAVHLFEALVEDEHEKIRQLLSDPSQSNLEDYVQTRWPGDVDAQDLAIEMASAVEAAPLLRPIGTKILTTARERMEAVCARNNIPVPLTEKGATCLNGDACAMTHDPLLVAFARYGSITTLRSRARRLKTAADMGLPIQPRFDNLKETGRTSANAGASKPGKPATSFGDQTQNLPRDPGLRECYVARPGCLILSVDWKAAELHTLAQTCIDLGFGSVLGNVLNKGIDVHIWFACKMRGWAYEWAVDKARTPEEKKQIKKARQAAKACNFGFPGGLGLEKFRLFARKQYGVALTEQEAGANKGEWLSAFPEMRPYFNHISKLVDSGQTQIHFGSKRHRGDLRYTAAANSYFQGRVADMLKDAGFSMLYDIWEGWINARFWNEAHDEILIEFPEAESDRVVDWAVGHMDAAGRRWCPDVPAKAEPALQRHWRKGAEPAYRGGRLIPWEDRDLSSDEVQKILAWRGDPLQGSWVIGIEERRFNEQSDHH